MRKLLSLCLWSMFFLFAQQAVIAQGSCNNNRYIDDNFDVEVISNISFGSAPHGESGFLPIPLLTFSQTNTVDKNLLLDLYLPQGDTLTKRPLIVMAFGGAFITGSKTYQPLVQACQAWARKGFVVASIDYRLGFTLNPDAEEQTIRAVYRGIQDFAAAVRFLKFNADEYKIDTNIIIGGGHSAGGFSALHDAFVVEADRFESDITAPTYLYQASDNSTWPDLGCAECGGNNLNASPNNLDGKIDIVVNLWGAIADLSWIDAGEAPVISFHGDNDVIVPINSGAPFGENIGGNFFPTTHGSIPIHERLDEVGIYNELHVFEGEGHEPWGLINVMDSEIFNYIVDSTVAFLVDVMQPELPIITGTEMIIAGNTYTYSVPALTNATYCWEVINGTIIADNGHEITIQWDAGITTGTIYQHTLNRNVVESDLATLEVTTVVTPPQRAFAKVFLEGAYTDGLLNSNLDIPLEQPYDDMPWNYMGGETVAAMPANAIDWVLVELRNPDNFAIIDQRAALLLEDGTLQDADGIAGVAFNALVTNSGDYAIVVRHRNHLDVLSANPVSLPNMATTPYDFSAAMNQALGEDQMIEVAAGVYALCAGDIDGTGVINVDDFNHYLEEINTNGYLQSDCNFDQNNTLNDFNLYQPNASIIGISQIRY